MRYIRTKDGEIFEYAGKERTPYGDLISADGTHYRYDCVLKEADTIEELCDEFVCIKQDRTKAIHTNDINNLVYWKMNFKFKDECNFYGAIWTKKGLIYVAQMNEKGVLELL